MNLFPALKKAFTKEPYSARQAQHMAEVIAWGPVVFEVAHILLKRGILERLRESDQGMTRQEIAAAANLSDYAAKVLTDSALTAGIILIDDKTDRFQIANIGRMLLIDPHIRANVDFNHDVNYEGWFHLEESLEQGKPVGLKHFGSWPTIYEGLSQLPAEVQKSWFGFDHFYSDHSFDQALDIVFHRHHTRRLMDVGGNTGRWAMKCVAYDPEVRVTIVDLPQQLEMMRKATWGQDGADRIDGYGMNLLDRSQSFPAEPYDAIWMSQFLDCFGQDEIVDILTRAAKVMAPDTRLYIMETFWDRQNFATAAFCLAQTSLYFTALANGNSKMYHSDDMTDMVHQAGLEVEELHDGLGWGHTIMVCRKRQA